MINKVAILAYYKYDIKTIIEIYLFDYIFNIVLYQLNDNGL